MLFLGKGGILRSKDDDRAIDFFDKSLEMDANGYILVSLLYVIDSNFLAS